MNKTSKPLGTKPFPWLIVALVDRLLCKGGQPKAAHEEPAQRRFNGSSLALFAGLLLGLLSLTACGPSEKQKAEAAELKRIECLDKFCQGDVDPRTDYTKDALLKLNGQWYIGPKEYVKGMSGLAFYWPSKTPVAGLPNGRPYPEKGQDFYDVAIEIFLTGRGRWPDEVRDNPTPWKRENGESPFEKEMKQEGYRAERQQLRPDLEHAKYFGSDGKTNMHQVFTAINEREPLSGGSPSIFCRSKNSSKTIDELSSCTGGFYWTEDIYVELRLAGKHVHDWPEIYKEIIRVLQLLKKV